MLHLVILQVKAWIKSYKHTRNLIQFSKYFLTIKIFIWICTFHKNYVVATNKYEIKMVDFYCNKNGTSEGRKLIQKKNGNSVFYLIFLLHFTDLNMVYNKM